MEHVRADLEQYQLDMIEFVKRVPRCALWVPIGAGKTISTLTAFNDLYMNLDAYRALVIAPLRVAEKVWADEIKDWAHVRGLRFMFLTGSAKAIKNKIRRYMPVVDVWGLSCDSVHVLARLYLARPIPWDWLIVDESSRFKKASAKRTKSLRLLTIHPPRVTELTGTPMSNGVKDIWSQIYMLDRGQRLGPTMNGFKERFFIGASGGITETPNKVAQIRIQKAIADIVYVLRPEEFKSERKPLTNLIHLDLGPKLQADYDKFKRRLVLDTLKSEKVIKAVNAAAITQKLLQFACIAEGTDVLTDSGWKPIEKVTALDRVWNGVEWANSFGSHISGYTSVIECGGVFMTPDHRVLTNDSWATAEKIRDDSSLRRAEVRLPDGYSNSWADEEQKHSVAMSVRLRKRSDTHRLKLFQRESIAEKILRLYPRRACLKGARRARSSESRNDGSSFVLPVDRYAFSMLQRMRQGLQKLRRQRNKNVSSLARIIRQFCKGHGADLCFRVTDRSTKQRQGILQVQLSMGRLDNTVKQYPSKCLDQHTKRADDCSASRASPRTEICHRSPKNTSRQFGSSTSGEKAKVYDVVNVQPLNCFTVRGSSGEIFIVHNSGSVYDEEHIAHHVHDIKLDALKELVEDNQGLPLLIGYGFTHEVAAIRKAFPQAELFGKDPAQQDRWNRGEIPMLLAHPRSAGHGLNLQFGGHILVWYSWGYDLEVHVQMCGRLPRKGQKNQVIMHYLTMRNTIDELVTQALTHKDREQVAFQSSLKQHILDIVKSLKGVA